MKKYIMVLLLAALISFLYACHCCLPPVPAPVEGIYIKHNGNIIWNGTLVDTIKNDTITLYGVGDYDKIKIKFYLNPAITQPVFVFAQPYIPYLVKNYQAMYYLPDNATHNTFIYKLDSTAVNTLGIAYGPQTNWLTGNFNLLFKLTNPTGNNNFDTTRVNFSNGIFTLKLHN